MLVHRKEYSIRSRKGALLVGLKYPAQRRTYRFATQVKKAVTPPVCPARDLINPPGVMLLMPFLCTKLLHLECESLSCPPVTLLGARPWPVQLPTPRPGLTCAVWPGSPAAQRA